MLVVRPRNLHNRWHEHEAPFTGSIILAIILLNVWLTSNFAQLLATNTEYDCTVSLLDVFLHEIFITFFGGSSFCFIFNSMTSAAHCLFNFAHPKALETLGLHLIVCKRSQ